MSYYKKFLPDGRSDKLTRAIPVSAAWNAGRVRIPKLRSRLETDAEVAARLIADGCSSDVKHLNKHVLELLLAARKLPPRKWIDEWV